MDKLRNSVNPNSSLIRGAKISIVRNDVKSLSFEDIAKGHKSILPVSLQIADFIKSEFSKIKK